MSRLVVALAFSLIGDCTGHWTNDKGHSSLRAGESKLQSVRILEHNPNRRDENPFAGVIFGLILWWIVPVCLWNNERIAIKQYKMQLKAERYSIHVDDPEKDPIEEMDGQIVYITGTSTVKEILKDDKFPNVESQGAIKLRRIVEMLQWVETEHKDDDDDKEYYTYSMEWRDSYQEVKHESSKRNPPIVMESSSRGNSYRASMALSNGNGHDCTAAQHVNVKLGAYYLSNYVIRELNNWKDKELSVEMLTEKKLQSGNERFMKDKAELDSDGWWYFGGKNDIGDARVRFEELCPGPTSIVGVLSKTSSGWTFVPIMRPSAKGAGDSLCAELGGSCCFRVKELHYDGSAEEYDELVEDLKKRAPELTKKERGAFQRSMTTAEVTSYNPEEDIGDLCCVGPFGGSVIKLMHTMGLEEEFLGVSEKDEELHEMMSREGDEAANRHHMMRVVGWLLLILGSFLIIAPIIKILNFHWIATLLGGGLISIVLCCMACACSTGAFCCIVSVSWIAHRPFLSGAGILLAILMFAGLYMWIYDQEHASQASHSLAHFGHRPTSFMALTQTLADTASIGFH
jgi:hypothetical protein